MSSTLTYEELCAAHRWDVPRAVQHRRRRLRQASARQAGDGLGELRRRRRASSTGASCRISRTRRRTRWRARGVGARRPRRRRAAADARDRGDLLRRLEARRDPALDVGALRRRRDRAPAPRLRRAAARHRCRQRAALRPPWAPDVLVLDEDDARRRADRLRLRRHRGRRSGAALLHLRHDRAREGHRARAPLHPRPRGVRLLPRGAGRRALPRHGRVGVGGRHRAAARARGGSAPCSASTGARAASTRTSSSTSSAGTR